MKNDMKWAWNTREDDDYWYYCDYDTREEAINEALSLVNNLKKDQNTEYPIIYVGRCEEIPLRIDVNTEGVLEYLDEAYCDDSGCDYYIYDGVSDEDFEWLEEQLSEVMVKFHKRIKLEPCWYNIVNIEEVHLGQYINVGEVC